MIGEGKNSEMVGIINKSEMGIWSLNRGEKGVRIRGGGLRIGGWIIGESGVGGGRD